jgi:hypothetical protein
MYLIGELLSYPESGQREVTALAIALIATGCTHAGPSGRGVVSGLAPLCYGPGPNLNLSPTTVIHAMPKSGGPVSSIRVTTNKKQRTYRITLVPGVYTIGVAGGRTTTVTVKAGKTLTGMDLPQLGCL